MKSKQLNKANMPGRMKIGPSKTGSGAAPRKSEVKLKTKKRK